MQDIPKRIKRLLREQSMLAHEEELRRALLPLANSFEEWKAGKLDSGRLSLMIHDFHQGPSRELFSKYNSAFLELNVAGAIVGGILDRKTIPEEVLEHLSKAIAFCEDKRR